MKTIEHSGEVCRVADDTFPGMFKTLTPDEVGDYRAWADEQPEGTIIKPVYHPVVQDQLFINGKGKEA